MMHAQLDSVRGSASLIAELASATPIVDRSAGSRRYRPRALIRRLEKAIGLAGITRVADISYLLPNAGAVWQATRPHVLSHAFLGQNSGSQGRGADADSARVAAIMEAMEVYCAEPRQALLVRGAFSFLRRANTIVPPSRFFVSRQGSEVPPRDDEPLMWTTALCLEMGVDVLVPAETVYFAFNAADYGTQPHFLESSNGLSAGGSLVEATLHALYELTERHFVAGWHAGDADIVFERMRSGDLVGSRSYDRLRADYPEAQVGVFVLRHDSKAKGLVSVLAVAVGGDGEMYHGSRCHVDARVAIEGALAEAIQSRAIQHSGTREDISFRDRPERALSSREQLEVLMLIPESVSLRSLLRRRSRSAATLQQELGQLIALVHGLGFPTIAVKNLTRVGLEVPVVRVLVPGMRMQAFLRPRPYNLGHVMQCQYCLDL